PIARGEFCVASHFSTEAAFIERHADNHADLEFLAKREEFILWRLVEDAIDDLDRVHKAGTDCLDSVFRLPAVQAESEKANRAIPLEFLDRAAEVGLVGPGVVPDVVLKQVNGIGAELFANQIGVSENVIGRKDVVILI